MPTVVYSGAHGKDQPRKVSWINTSSFPNSNMTTTELRKSNSNPVRDKESSNLASKLLSDAFKLITEGISRACHLKRNFREEILLIFF